MHGQLDARFEWRVRCTATRADGTAFVVHEAVACDRAAQMQLVYNRIEVWDPSGGLVRTLLRRHHLRWWERAELEEVLAGLGFVDIHVPGDDTGWVAVGHRPACAALQSVPAGADESRRPVRRACTRTGAGSSPLRTSRAGRHSRREPHQLRPHRTWERSAWTSAIT